MSYANKLLEQIFNEHLYNLHTCMPCTVVAYNPETLEADIQPIFWRKKAGVY